MGFPLVDWTMDDDTPATVTDPRDLATVSPDKIKADKTFVRDVANALRASGKLGVDEPWHPVTREDGSVIVRRGPKPEDD